MGNFSTTQTRTARKAHCCYECNVTISPGQKYVRLSGAYDGHGYSYPLCLPCDAVTTWALTSGPLRDVDPEDRAHNILTDLLELDVLVRGPRWADDPADLSVAPEWAHVLTVDPVRHYPVLAPTQEQPQ